jgi:hypothetical protein
MDRSGRLEYFPMLKRANFVETESQVMDLDDKEFHELVLLASDAAVATVQVQAVLSTPTEAERIAALKVPKNPVDVKAALEAGARIADEILDAYAADCLSKVFDSNIVSKYF